jgi:hypothetical protein
MEGGGKERGRPPCGNKKMTHGSHFLVVGIKKVGAGENEFK